MPTPAITQIIVPSGACAWHVTGHSLARRLLADERIGMSHPQPAKASWYSRDDVSGRPRGAAGQEYADHAGWRSAMLRVFSTTRFVARQPAIEAQAQALCRQIHRMAPPVDFNAEFSVPYCSRVIMELLDVPGSMIDDAMRWTEQGATADDIGLSLTGMRSLLGYATELVEQRGTAPPPDVIGQLVALNAARERPDLGAVIKLVAGMLAFGRETPASALSTTLALLLENPTDYARVRDDPRLRSSAIEEALRMFSPPAATPHGLLRYAHTELDADGTAIAAGDMMLVDIARANFDASVFARPDVFTPDRNPNPHVTFGSGFYLCNFARLARIELAAALDAVLTTFPTLRLGKPLAYNTRLRTRSVTELVVSW
ncbi:cytochrome P450 [Kribbella sp. NPDC050820]|uniref:cytochrome P450 n=1 Tax=Kribbella sp. NPDC050820 TaxID=3155408 RepID=UPI00340FCC69